MKKLLIGLVAVGAVLVTLPMFAAFEAHVVNVTARIENALYVHPQSRQFGTVFPQEYLKKGMFVTFSESFSSDDQTRVGTVEYVIKQKPKPRVDALEDQKFCHENSPQDPADPNDPYYAKCYPLLCQYLSKTPDNFPEPGNDTGVPPFHATSAIATGKINKFGEDVGDNWLIDLAVPCFKGECAQDWDKFVHDLNPDAGDSEQYKLPKSLEHEVFGCDLWVEVTDIY